MAKYDWDSIEIAYKKGISVDVITKKYGIVKKTLINKIYAKKWEVNSEKLGNINSDVEALGHTLGKLSRHTQNDPILESIIVDKINTQIEDNGLIENNRKLAKLLQGVIVNKRKDIDLSNIKAISGTLKDIESIANPQATNKVEVNNTNAQQTVNEVKIIDA